MKQSATVTMRRCVTAVSNHYRLSAPGRIRDRLISAKRGIPQTQFRRLGINFLSQAFPVSNSPTLRSHKTLNYALANVAWFDFESAIAGLNV